VEYLHRELPRRHKNAFFQTARVQFDQTAAELCASIPGSSDERIVTGIMRLVAMIGDGHTRVQNPGAAMLLRGYPFQVDWFRDGYYVVRVRRTQQELLGARLVRIGDHDIADAAARLRELFPCDNVWTERTRVAGALRIAEYLHACGLIADTENAEFVFEDRNRPARAVRLSPIPAGVQINWVWASDVAPLAQQRTGEKYWFQALPGSKAVYLAYNTCSEPAAFRALCGRLFDVVDAQHAERLVIDLRRNGGGNSLVIEPLLWAAAWRGPLQRRGGVCVLIGRNTYSSAMMNAIALRKQLGAVLVGEPTGGSPNSYGEVKTLELPYSKLVISYSTKRFELQDGDARSVEPDLLVEASIDDFVEGRDPVLDAALALTQDQAGKRDQ
jgi:hypothetical protein